MWGIKIYKQTRFFLDALASLPVCLRRGCTTSMITTFQWPHVPFGGSWGTYLCDMVKVSAKIGQPDAFEWIVLGFIVQHPKHGGNMLCVSSVYSNHTVASARCVCICTSKTIGVVLFIVLFMVLFTTHRSDRFWVFSLSNRWRKLNSYSTHPCAHIMSPIYQEPTSLYVRSIQLIYCRFTTIVYSWLFTYSLMVCGLWIYWT